MEAREAVFVYSQELEKYPYPPEHPFNTIRAKRVREIVSSMGLLSGGGRREAAPEPVERIVLKKFHSARYLHVLKEASEGKFNAEALSMGIGTSDCPVFKGLYEGAVLAAGGTLVGAKLILSGEADAVFNPSGGFHHAGPQRASGFCYINDVALACMVLAEEGKRVLYLDVDVHHGDGVAYAFYDRRDVMTISLHQNPRTLFPGTGFEDEIGSGEGKGYCVNVPLPMGTYDEAYMKAFESLVPSLIGAFKPDVFVFELGADALAGDPLAHLLLTNNVYAEIINHLLSFNKPILMTGGGGYNIDNTVRAWALAWSILCGADTDKEVSPTVGGVMLGSIEWQGGLRDRHIVPTEQQRTVVAPAVEGVIKQVKETIFPLHNIVT
ncbi:MAG: acetoin utilization protein AcuC [Sedimentisphaerales bacterium]|nr:acetoin utilization protein AcuC [Sedimentisphaerales bacterium]